VAADNRSIQRIEVRRLRLEAAHILGKACHGEKDRISNHLVNASQRYIEPRAQSEWAGFHLQNLFACGCQRRSAWRVCIAGIVSLDSGDGSDVAALCVAHIHARLDAAEIALVHTWAPLASDESNTPGAARVLSPNTQKRPPANTSKAATEGLVEDRRLRFLRCGCGGDVRSAVALAVVNSPTPALEPNDVRVMKKSVQERAGCGCVAQDLSPVFDGAIG